MTFRYARHTKNLKPLENFYTGIVGLENLGGFKDHSGYDGLFLGLKGENWHLEFTVSDHAPANKFDDDDLLVFYLSSEIELSAIRKTIEQSGIRIETAKNPYWTENGFQISDPDGYKVVFSLKTKDLNGQDELTRLTRSKNINNWNQLLHYVRNLPYGRNANRHDLSLVLKEEQGSCSSKHAFLKKIADLNQLNSVQLMIGIYKMNHHNTPAIGDELLKSGLACVPEAHCYLMIHNRRLDLTWHNSDFDKLKPDLLKEIAIEPEQVDQFKIDYHQQFLKDWLRNENIGYTFDQIWKIRENCIGRMHERS